eukprot:11172746-Karenia_brevis.AAC.1
MAGAQGHPGSSAWQWKTAHCPFMRIKEWPNPDNMPVLNVHMDHQRRAKKHNEDDDDDHDHDDDDDDEDDDDE